MVGSRSVPFFPNIDVFFFIRLLLPISTGVLSGHSMVHEYEYDAVMVSHSGIRRLVHLLHIILKVDAGDWFQSFPLFSINETKLLGLSSPSLINFMDRNISSRLRLFILNSNKVCHKLSFI